MLVKSRSHHSLLPFIGSLSKAGFGTAPSSDLEMVGKHVNHLQLAHVKLSNEFHHEVELLASFMSTTNDRLTNAIAGIKTNHDLIETLRNKVSQTAHEI